MLTSALNVDKVDVVGSSVNHRPECHGICDLTVEPDIFVRREEPGELGSNDAQNVAQHREQDESTVQCQYQSSPTGDPNGPLESVEPGKLDIGGLENELEEEDWRVKWDAPDSTSHKQKYRSGDHKRGR